MTDSTEHTLLATMERSPQAAAAHDRAGWVGLFTTDGLVEDPVGSRAHVGAAAIGRFYDTFIGPREISFHRDLDVVCGTSVIRDLDLEVVMGSGVTMTIPALLRYDLREIHSEWKIATLQAFWELPAMMWQFLRHGMAAVPATVALSRGLIRNQRLGGAAGFAAGFRRVGSPHKTLVESFVDSVGRGDSWAAEQTLAPDAAITLGDSDTADIAVLAEEWRGATTTKVIAAGATVAASVTAGPQRDVLFAEFTRRGAGIGRIRYFPQ